MGRIIGIDLGTSNSCVAIIEGGEPKVISNSEGDRLTPSVVSFTKAGGRIVGITAKRQAVLNPARTFASVKRLLGRRWDEDEVQELVRLMAYPCLRAENGDVRVGDAEEAWAPEQILAMVLEKLRADAEAVVGEGVTQAVITVPANYNDLQRTATRTAAQIAGLEVVRLVNEPTAAALAYGYSRRKAGVFAVYDLGAGTFDITVLSSQQGALAFQVRATGGAHRLGGDDIDALIADALHQRFEKTHGFALDQSPATRQRIITAAEDAKKALSNVEATRVTLPFIGTGPQGPVHLETELFRSELEQLMRPLVDRTLEVCESVLRDAGYEPHQVDEVLLVGGQTRAPIVKRAVANFFGREPTRGVEPDEAVAMGAALMGSLTETEMVDRVVADVCPLSLGVETAGGLFTPLIPRNTPIPTRATKTFTTTADNQMMIRVNVYQGERQRASDNLLLGVLDLVGIPPARRAGAPRSRSRSRWTATASCTSRRRT
ncbi:MAG: Hsp70 family protein [Deltaproteobacteria bacterium]|nr:Hsp70 family protein [Deltaproteobacteria bacterium]